MHHTTNDGVTHMINPMIGMPQGLEWLVILASWASLRASISRCSGVLSSSSSSRRLLVSVLKMRSA